jgi:hypothetical protein
LLRRGILVGALSSFVMAGVLTGCDSEPQGSSDAGEQATQPVAQQESVGEAEETIESTAGDTSEGLGCSEKEYTEREEMRIGDFAPPEDVPSYEVVDEAQIERDCIRAARLLVDTQARSQADYTLIARDIKSEYQDLDAVTIEFTDTTTTFSYNGSALIFNTPPGAYYMGFIYGPPNNEGYFVTAAKD